MKISARIAGIRYTSTLPCSLEMFSIENLEAALKKHTSFILETSETRRVAACWWVSPKRTRSYPFARVYDILDFEGRRVAIIPAVKDEGAGGERDFLQWSTLSMLSLLDVYVIPTYYADAARKVKRKNKIKGQKFSAVHVEGMLRELMGFKSGALYWNLMMVERLGEVTRMALDAYARISKRLRVKMHSRAAARERIAELNLKKKQCIKSFGFLSQEAQARERVTTHVGERVSGTKESITIRNYLGGNYHLTCDEVEVRGDSIRLTEAKHTEKDSFPSEQAIKDGLVKMMLFTNLVNVRVDGRKYRPIAVLKITRKRGAALNNSQEQRVQSLQKEAEINGFQLAVEDAP